MVIDLERIDSDHQPNTFHIDQYRCNASLPEMRSPRSENLCMSFSHVYVISCQSAQRHFIQILEPPKIHFSLLGEAFTGTPAPAQDVYTMSVTEISEAGLGPIALAMAPHGPCQAQKQQAWSSLNLVVAEFMIFVNALKTMSAANEARGPRGLLGDHRPGISEVVFGQRLFSGQISNVPFTKVTIYALNNCKQSLGTHRRDILQVNLCRVFKLAKEVAASGKPLNYTIMPMMDADGAPDLPVPIER